MVEKAQGILYPRLKGESTSIFDTYGDGYTSILPTDHGKEDPRMHTYIHRVWAN